MLSLIERGREAEEAGGAGGDIEAWDKAVGRVKIETDGVWRERGPVLQPVSSQANVLSFSKVSKTDHAMLQWSRRINVVVPLRLLLLTADRS